MLRRARRWLAALDTPAPGTPPPPPPGPAPAAPASPAPAAADDALAVVCDRFAMQFLALAEKQRAALDVLEADEQDPGRLRRLYEVDHAVALTRRAARELRVLAGRDGEELAGHTTTLVDVVRMAASSIESYTRVEIGAVADLAVPAFAADDTAAILAPLLDNATRYSPDPVTVSAHPMEDGGVVFRVTDSGMGVAPAELDALNAALAGAAPLPADRGSGRTGLAVVRRLARRHGVRVRLADRASARPGVSGGTTAIVSLPPQLVCESPGGAPVLGPLGGASAGSGPRSGGRAEGAPAARTPEPPELPPHLRVGPGPIGADAAPPPEPPPPPRPPAGSLPRRDPTSLRGAPPSGRRRLLAADSAPGGSFADDLDAFTGAAGTGPPAHDRSDNEVS
ncbi:sensor histidine kinase [Nocardiopsis trehalosi]|uniref:sensor histidine kinase n=1 Tax=Nocardiopsis trehalosi TaxID=109329 RepID=UPI000AE5DB33|nr:ATP-binding protein [Nocardiopsis trehalosi]